MRALPSTLGLLVLAGCSQVVVDVTIVGAGSVRAEGQECSASCTMRLAPNAQLQAVAVAGLSFQGWSGICAGVSECRAKQGALSATFVSTSTLHVMVTGQGVVRRATGGECASDCSWEQWEPGEIQAVPDTGWTFVGWGGACTGLAPRCTPGAGEVTATFEDRRLTILIGGHGAGSVFEPGVDGGFNCSSDCVIQIPSGTAVVDARAQLGSVLSSASGGCVEFPCAINTPNTISTRFERRRVATIDISGPGQVSVNRVLCIANPCSLEVSAAGLTEIVALPDPGQRFQSWEGTVAATALAISIPAGDENIHLVAHFEPDLTGSAFSRQWPTADQNGLGLERGKINSGRLMLPIALTAPVSVFGTPTQPPNNTMMLEFTFRGQLNRASSFASDAGTVAVRDFIGEQTGYVLAGTCDDGALIGSHRCSGTSNGARSTFVARWDFDAGFITSFANVLPPGTSQDAYVNQQIQPFDGGYLVPTHGWYDTSTLAPTTRLGSFTTQFAGAVLLDSDLRPTRVLETGSFIPQPNGEGFPVVDNSILVSANVYQGAAFPTQSRCQFTGQSGVIYAGVVAKVDTDNCRTTWPVVSMPLSRSLTLTGGVMSLTGGLAIGVRTFGAVSWDNTSLNGYFDPEQLWLVFLSQDLAVTNAVKLGAEGSPGRDGIAAGKPTGADVTVAFRASQPTATFMGQPVPTLDGFPQRTIVARIGKDGLVKRSRLIGGRVDGIAWGEETLAVWGRSISAIPYTYNRATVNPTPVDGYFVLFFHEPSVLP